MQKQILHNPLASFEIALPTIRSTISVLMPIRDPPCLLCVPMPRYW